MSGEAEADPLLDAEHRAGAADPDDPAAIRLAAMNLLARREHSMAELRVKLSRRFSNSERIESQLQRLADEKLQSDERVVLDAQRVEMVENPAKFLIRVF